jgi:hypothetical protein
MCVAEDETRGADAIQLYGAASRSRIVLGEQLTPITGAGQKRLGCACASVDIYIDSIEAKHFAPLGAAGLCLP